MIVFVFSYPSLKFRAVSVPAIPLTALQYASYTSIPITATSLHRPIHPNQVDQAMLEFGIDGSEASSPNLRSTCSTYPLHHMIPPPPPLSYDIDPASSYDTNPASFMIFTLLHHMMYTILLNMIQTAPFII